MAHPHPHAREPPHHIGTRRGKLRELVFGLDDGMVSTMGVITGIAAGTGSRLLILLSGLVVILVEALSMAAGSFLSNKSEEELERKLLAEELHEIRHHPEKERRELKQFYTERGFPPAEQKILIERLMSDEDLLLEEMAHKELGIVFGHSEAPGKKAVIMYGAYVAGGIVPLVPYLVILPPAAITVSIAATAIGLFALGFGKGAIVGTSKAKSGIEMLLVGMGAALMGLAAGSVAGHLLGIEGALF